LDLATLHNEKTMITYSPKEPAFWNRADARTEMERIADICNGCRLCDNLCPSFTDLFDKIDVIDDAQEKAGRGSDNPALALTEADYDQVTNGCYQCKICYVKCPYVPPHAYALDFPRLLLRWQAIGVKERGPRFADKMLGDTALTGRVGSAFPGIMNWANSNKLTRLLMEKVMGIHRNKRLPKYYSLTFAKWFRRSQAPMNPSPVGKAAFFHTCSVNFNEPGVGRACVEVLRHNGVDVVVPPQVCCGMPQVGVGNLHAAQNAADANVASLLPYVDAGYTIVTPGPSCGYMMRQEYPEFATDGEAAKRVAKATMDICEYLMWLHKDGKLRTDFKSLGEKITYHLPCHLRAQNIGFKSRDLMKLIPGVEIGMVQQCSGHDGTWSMQTEHYEQSLKEGKKLFNHIERQAPATVASDCTLAHLHIAEGTGAKALHPIEIVARAYGV
jgi:glycerol-3-phosphate dehydrogenase subunit C